MISNLFRKLRPIRLLCFDYFPKILGVLSPPQPTLRHVWGCSAPSSPPECAPLGGGTFLETKSEETTPYGTGLNLTRGSFGRVNELS